MNLSFIYQVSSLISLLLLHLIPLVLLFVMNTLTFIKVKKNSNKVAVNNRRKRDLDIATALSIIVLIFIICHSFKFAINLVEFLDMFHGEGFFTYYIYHIIKFEVLSCPRDVN